MLYIIGGGPGAGKTTIARNLEQAFELDYIKADDFAEDHQEKANRVEHPINHAISLLDREKQPLHLLELNSAHELARQTELFFMLLDELKETPTDRAIIEGNCLRPELVAKHLELDHKAIWLIPTNDFLREHAPKREWLPDILEKSSHPEETLHTWIERDVQHNAFVREQAELCDLPYIDIDGTRNVDQITELVIESFGLRT